ncbi:hypothetical protein PRIPAC_88828 [Pristionchus pacificus]|uniref:AMP-binding protein n=1 Tax=Pristionchus pacificus TaxID=54126 RepID=A0A2A6B7F6_PRIPA|nr:hypothetical protein PRIPAC_88828 [Pristionchus pacificus]|eukprot:PDM61806.1 AMP-binding protein [Pristionchus pacificus]
MDSIFISSIVQSLKDSAIERPHDIAMYDETAKVRNISNRCLYVQVEKTSSFLRAHSFRSGDRAAIMMINAIEFPILHLGIWSCGGTIVGSSTLLNSDELRYQWIDSETTVVFTTQIHLKTVMRAARGCPAIRLIVCIRPSLDCEIEFDVIEEETKENKHVNSVKLGGSIDSLALIYYTSGTTGTQKGVLHTHRSLLAGVEIYARFILNEAHPAVGIAPEDSLKEHQILPTPFFHLMGFLYLNVCILTGLPAVIHFTADPDELLRMIAEYKPQYLLTYPSMVQHLTKKADGDMGSVKVMISSGSRLRKELAELFIQRYPSVKFLAQGFGMTEVGFTHLPLLIEQCSLDSVGVAVKEYEQKIMDINRARECLAGELGELCLRGPSVTAGYLNKEKETKEIIDEDGWIHTGDIGYVNELGELHLVDRLKDTINIDYKGTAHRVFPYLIERVLLNCPMVADAAGNEWIRAFIVKEDPLLDHGDIHELVTENLPDYMWLTGGIRFVQQIPRSGGGKILRRFLQTDPVAARNAA